MLYENSTGSKMKSMRTWIWIAGGISVLSGASMLASDWSKDGKLPHEPLAGMMLAKLASTQRVVSGLVSKDFSEVKRGAQDMLRICDATQWESHPDPVFGHHRTELRRQSVKLAGLADAQNLDGAAFAYMQTMSTCISCHEHCRDVLRIAELPKPMNRVVPIPAAEEEVSWSGMPTLRR